MLHQNPRTHGGEKSAAHKTSQNTIFVVQPNSSGSGCSHTQALLAVWRRPGGSCLSFLRTLCSGVQYKGVRQASRNVTVNVIINRFIINQCKDECSQADRTGIKRLINCLTNHSLYEGKFAFPSGQHIDGPGLRLSLTPANSFDHSQVFAHSRSHT